MIRADLVHIRSSPSPARQAMRVPQFWGCLCRGREMWLQGAGCKAPDSIKLAFRRFITVLSRENVHLSLGGRESRPGILAIIGQERRRPFCSDRET